MTLHLRAHRPRHKFAIEFPGDSHRCRARTSRYEALPSEATIVGAARQPRFMRAVTATQSEVKGVGRAILTGLN